MQVCVLKNLKFYTFFFNLNFTHKSTYYNSKLETESFNTYWWNNAIYGFLHFEKFLVVMGYHSLRPLIFRLL